jgi:ubiquinol-cytochrome c reductase cytochrome c subunit
MRRASRVCVLAALAAVAALAPAASALGQGDAQRGRRLFLEGCASCHGLAARGIPGNGPSLRGVGARSADFYLTTGRMPLSHPGDEPTRATPLYSTEEIDDLVAYVGSLGGPPIPDVRAERGQLNEGLRLFSEHCAGCHQVVGEGGIVDGAIAPALHDATAVQIAEAVRVGPYLMPRFDESEISDDELNSIVRYVLETRSPDDRGGWGIGHLGPIPEGMVAWLIGGAVLVVLARLIGRRLA